MSEEPIYLATRKSPLALKQAELALEYLEGKLVGTQMEIMGMTTTGDEQQTWSLEKEGGKGLFVKELEVALLEGSAKMAIHSAKDMPTELPEGLVLAGYLPRADVRDVLVKRHGEDELEVIATGSPRRREQLKGNYPGVSFKEIRGRVETRLKKILEGYADATVLAAAGLDRLEISNEGTFEGLVFERIPVNEMVPAPGQGAIAIECRQEDAEELGSYLCQETGLAVKWERTFLELLGGGCQIAHAAHLEGNQLHIYHQGCGYRGFEVDTQQGASVQIERILKELRLW